MAYGGAGVAVLDRARQDDWSAPAARPTLVPTSPAEPGRGTRRDHVALCPEIDCVRHLLPAHLIDRAEIQAIRSGVGADTVLVAWGQIGEETYVAELAASLGIEFEPLFSTPRAACELSDRDLIHAANKGLVPLRDRHGMKFVLAPGLVDSRQLVTSAGNEMPERIRLTSPSRLRDFVRRHTASEIAYDAAERLRAERPDLSAGVRHINRLHVALLAALCVCGALLMPDAATLAIEILLGAVFLAWIGLRVLSLFSERRLRREDVRTIADRDLPTYSVIIALHREAAAVPRLIRALRLLDYPAPKLDIKLVLEPDDNETYEALRHLQLGPPFEILIAPNAGPRTKPKALNAALPFVRGDFVAVYDAEDEPEPDQLRQALEVFEAESENLACVQGRLTIDNTNDSWLTRMFTAEYAGLFDVLLPGLAAWRLPLPLGGSSNHFRTSVLRQVGAWDPYNVTEDADLGMRMARLGYKTAVIPSTTYEEAPSRFRPWLGQRTRWFKGWMQVWLVHMRTPLALYREQGLAGFIVFHLLVGGSVLAALVHVPFASRLGWTMLRDGVTLNAFVGFDSALLLGGYLISASLGIVGLARRRLLGCSWVLLLIPLYWLLLSVAAWRALWQLIRDPYRWEKTEHGLARTSRLGAQEFGAQEFGAQR